MVSDSELAARVHDFLRGSDLKKTTNNIVLKKLENDFGLDLSHKKPFLRDQVHFFLQTQYDNSEELQGGADFETTQHDERNDDVSDSEDDDPNALNLRASSSSNHNHNNNNGSSSFKGVNKFSRVGENSKEKKKRIRSGKLCTLSPQLQKFLGVSNMAKTEVVKHLWSYIREKNLQDPQDGKNIICDEPLRDLLGVDSINILRFNKALTKHIWPSASARSMRKEKRRKREREEEADGQKKVYSGFLAPLPLSETLIKFLGTGEAALTRADVIKRVWEYIKDKSLQDPSDKKTVICDEKLKELFKVDSFHGFTVSKLLTPHLGKP